MIVFDEDEDLGKVVESKELQSFGDKPIESFKVLVYAAGGNKLSNLCKFKFVSKAPTDYKEFCIAFVCKIRSKIYHQKNTNPSQWFIFKVISDTEVHCLSQKDLLNNYGFDINKFYKSDFFAEGLAYFEKSIKHGIKYEVPAFIKAHGKEKAVDALTSYDGKNRLTVKEAATRYVTAIQNSLQYLHDTRTNDKFYKLISYDGTVFEADEAKKNVVGYAIGIEKDGKVMFVSMSPDAPYLSEFPYSVNNEKVSDADLKVFERPLFGSLKGAKNYKVSYAKEDAERYYKNGGKATYTIVDEAEKKHATEDSANLAYEAALDQAIEEALAEIYK